MVFSDKKFVLNLGIKASWHNPFKFINVLREIESNQIESETGNILQDAKC